MPKTQKTVLAVDDEAADLNLVCKTLGDQKFKVLVAASYRDAMNVYKIHRGEIDLLITDVSLPGKNGCELARDLLQLSPDMKVIFVSGPTGAEVCRYYNMPVTDPHFLEKPFDSEALLQRVRTIIGRKPAMRSVGAE